MENRHGGAEMVHKPGDQLGRQGNLRHQIDGRAALLQGRCDQAEVNRGLAAAGDAVEKRCAGLFGLHLTGKAVKGRLLLGIENGRRRGRRRRRRRLRQHRPEVQPEISQLLQPPDRGHGSARKVAKLLHADGVQLGQKRQNLLLQRRAAALAGGIGHGLLPGDGQLGRLLHLVPHLAGIGEIGADPALSLEIR